MIPGALKAAIKAAKKAPEFAAKHPVTAAGLGAGTGALVVGTDAALRPMGSVDQVEKSIMREHVGGAGAKYACDELAQLSERKTFLATKVSFEKTADFDPAKAMGEKAVGESVSEGFGWIRRLIGATAQAIKTKFSDEPKRKRIMNDIVTNDPVVSMFETEQPGGAFQALNTMKQFAPTLSTNPAIVQSFLRNAAMSGGPLDHQTIRGLADAETSVLKAKNEGAWGTRRP